MKTLRLFASLLLCACTARALDQNGNQQSDVWEMIYGASGLAAGGDADGDGWSNAAESAAGTNPFDPTSRPGLNVAPWSAVQFSLGYARIAGKRYRIESKADLSLATWTTEATEVAPDANAVASLFNKPAGAKFWRLEVDDVDSDGDGLADAEEWWLGFDPATNHSDRNDSTDIARVTAGLGAVSTVTLGVLDARMSERWPDPGLVVVRRSGGLRPVTVNVSFTGTAVRGVDYTASIAGGTVFTPAGVREVPVLLDPIADADDAETAETIVVTVQSGAGYTLGATTSGTVTLENETATSLPTAKAAARFLIQAVFGPDQDSTADADDIPENVEEVMAMGFNAWIDNQFTRPIGYLQPYVDWAVVNADALGLYGNYKEHSWWGRAMGAPKLRPDAATTVQPDPLRQRVAFALSEILVVSDRPEALAVEQQGMANYYDLFEQHAFGNYRDLLRAQNQHPFLAARTRRAFSEWRTPLRS